MGDHVCLLYGLKPSKTENVRLKKPNLCIVTGLGMRNSEEEVGGMQVLKHRH